MTEQRRLGQNLLMYAITGKMLGSHDSEDCATCEDNEGVCVLPVVT